MRLFLFFVAVLFLASCKTIKTDPPSQSYIPFEFKPRLSTLNIPFEVPVEDLENIINSNLTGLLYEDANLYDDDMQMKIWKQNTIALDVVGDEFRFKVPLKIWLKAGYRVNQYGITIADYAETNCALTVNFVSGIKVSPDWSVSTNTRMTGYEWITEPKLDMIMFDLPLTYVADKIIASQKTKIASLIDEKTAAYIQIRDYVQPAWSMAQEPIALSGDPASWLKIAPAEIHMSPLMGRAGLLQSSIGMDAYLYVTLGQKPAGESKPLPRLTMANNNTGYFNLSILSDISYGYAKELAKKYFEGMEFEFRNGKKKIRIDEVDLYGSKGKMVIGLLLSGSLKGKVFLEGLPYYEPSSKSIRVREVEFNIDTKNKLIRSADWLAHNVFLKKIESYLSIPVADQIKENEKMIEEALSGKQINSYVTLDGRIIQIAPETIFLNEAGIGTIINVKGILNVKLRGR